MTSGIYQLTFSDGSFYIGKSNDIERRWKEHFTKFGKGTAAAAMQAAYDSYGEPECDILIEAHEDHIDILEGLFIYANWDSIKILNGNKPKPPDQNVIDVWKTANKDFWKLSTPEHFLSWNNQVYKLNNEVSKLKDKVHQIKNGSLVEELESKLYNEKVNVEFYRKQVEVLKSRGFFARLFNL